MAIFPKTLLETEIDLGILYITPFKVLISLVHFNFSEEIAVWMTK